MRKEFGQISGTAARADSSPGEWPAKVAPAGIHLSNACLRRLCATLQQESDLRELSGEKKSFRMRESVLEHVDVDIYEKRETLDALRPINENDETK
jgi:hypothetical protein